MTQTTVKQHYVPRAFLRKWTLNEKFFPIKVSEVNLEDSKILNESGVDTFCFENYFYANERGKKDDFSQTAEKLLTEMENKMYPILNSFEAKILNNIEINYEDRRSLAEVMSLFDIRGKRGAQKSNNMITQLFDNLKKREGMTNESILKLMNSTENEVIIKSETEVEMATKQHLRQFRHAGDIAHHIANKDWMIEVSKNNDFIVTDTPYFEIFPEYTGIFSQNIYDRIQVFVLSPKVVIFIRKPESITDPRVYLDNSNELISSHFTRVFDITNDKKMIDGINATLFDYCIMFGFHFKKEILERLLKYTFDNKK